MKVKVQCNCGAKFEFEVEPVEGRMPMAIQCPTCGADATDLANSVITSQLTTPGTPATGGGGLHIRQSSAPSHAGTTAYKPAPQSPAASDTPAKTTPRAAKLSAVEELRQTEVAYTIFKRVILSVILLAFITAGTVAWYTYFAREPKIAMSLPLPSNDPALGQPYVDPGDYHLVGAGRLLVISNESLILQDAAAHKIVWTSKLPWSAAEDSGALVTWMGVVNNHHLAHANSNEVWVAEAGHLARVELASGAVHDIPITGATQSISVGPDSAVISSGSGNRVETLTRIPFAGGDSKTENLTAPVNAPPEKITTAQLRAAGFKGAIPPDATQIAKLLNPTARMTGNEGDAMGSGPSKIALVNPPDRVDFLEAGENVLEFRPRLLQAKWVDRAALKQKKNASSILDSATLSADQGTEAAEEMLNENQRDATGGVEHVNVSSYEVVLQRHFSSESIPAWRGQVVGVPEMFCLKTVDVLAAGTNLYVFDKQNKLLWESKSAYPLCPGDDEGNPTLVESGDALYVADLGNLTKFDLKSGTVRWRYNAVRVSQIKVDGALGLYVVSSTASSESLTYSQEIQLKKKVHTLMQRVNSITGTAMWKQEASGDHVFISGKYVYASRINWVTVELELENGPQPHYYTTLLDPKTGLPIWTYHRANQRGAKVEVSDRWVMQQFGDRVVVLNFFSL